MNLKRYLAYPLLGCLLLSCGDIREEYPSSGIPIRFSCDVGTRGSVITTEDMTSMGVTAFCHTGSFNAANAGDPNFMKNQLMTNTDQVWTYSPVKYWPEGGEQKISFFAYSPYSDAGNGLSISGLALSYVTPAASQNHPDLLTATPVKDQTNPTSTISFTFSHVLARVSFTFEVAPAVGGEVSEVILSGIKSKGSIQLDNETAAWSIDEAETTTVSYFYNSSDIPSDTPSANSSAKDYMMLLPQNLTADVKLSFKVGNTDKEVTLSGYTVPKWEKGQAYNYNIKIDN